MNLTLARPNNVQARLLLVMGLLATAAIVLSAMPFLGLGGHMHWVLWMVGTGRISWWQGVTYILAALPGYIRGLPWIVEGVKWIVAWVAEDGIGAIAEILGTLSLTGWGGILLAIIGAGFIG